MNRAMTQEQFVQVVDAILAGKYSWACVLILRFAGYNPLHYIPYRTYNRLMKEHSPSFHKKCGDRSPSVEKTSSTQESSWEIRDLNYLESLEKNRSQVKGGNRVVPMFSWRDDYSMIHSRSRN